MLTISEVMEMLRASRATVYRLRRCGALKTIAIPNLGPRITAESVDRLIASKEAA